MAALPPCKLLMSWLDRSSLAATFSIVGAVIYSATWFVCAIIMLGYEEQWIGPDEAFYTLGSMAPVEQVAYVVGRYVLSFPAGPPHWVGDFALYPLTALASGALSGAGLGWVADRQV